MARKSLALVSALALLPIAVASADCSSHSASTSGGAGGSAGAFQADPPRVYVAKVKNILVGLPPTDDEVQKVTADPTQLATLIDGWMTMPEYTAKMQKFFELAFQQTQITPSSFIDMMPPDGIGTGVGVPMLVQNVSESFARTVLELIAEGSPLSDAMTTKRVMMTPPLMELYAFLDTYHVDDDAKIPPSTTSPPPWPPTPPSPRPGRRSSAIMPTRGPASRPIPSSSGSSACSRARSSRGAPWCASCSRRPSPPTPLPP